MTNKKMKSACCSRNFVVNTIFIALLIAFVTIASTHYQNKPVIAEIPQLHFYGDQNLDYLSWLAAWIEEKSYESTGVRLIPSLKYLFLAQRYAELIDNQKQNERFYPDWLFVYGVIPEVVMPTTQENLQQISLLDKNTIKKMMTADKIEEAKKVFSHFISPITPHRRVIITRDTDIKSGKNECKPVEGGKICYRDEPYQYITQDIGLILYPDEKGRNSHALMFDSFEKDNAYYYKLLTQEGVKTIPVLEFRKNLISVSIAEEKFQTYDQADQTGLFWHTGEEYYMPTEQSTLLFFSSSYCFYCKKFMALVSEDLELQKVLRKYRLIKLDKELDSKLLKKYKVDGFPRFIILNKDMKEIRKQNGYDERDDLMKFFSEGGK